MIEAPTDCPCCGSALQWSNDLLYCKNSLCDAVSAKQVKHFASTLKIKGLGPASIEKLGLTTISQIYNLTRDELRAGLGSEKMGDKLFEEISESVYRPLNTVLPAFGIPLVGQSVTDKLSKACSSIFDITAEVCKNAGVGDKATANLLKWLETDEEYLQLPFSYEFAEQSTPAALESRGVVCISGKLNSYATKQEAQKILESLGFIVKSTITKDVTILVNESGRETSKTQKARDSGVTIVTDLHKFIGDLS